MSDTPISSSDAVALRDNDRKLFAQYVTGERQKWRDRMRELVIETADIVVQRDPLSPYKVRKLHVIRAELRVRLNPEKNNPDQKIIDNIDQIIIRYKDNYEERLKCLHLFEEEVSWLLKEDWERVKHEIRPLWQWLRKQRKVDRKSDPKSISPSEDECDLKKKDLFSVFLFIGLLCISTFFISCSYELTQVLIDKDKKCCENECNEKNDEKTCKKIKQDLCLKPASIEVDKTAVVPQIQPNQITVSPVIINEPDNDKDNECLSKLEKLKTDLSVEISNAFKNSMKK